MKRKCSDFLPLVSTVTHWLALPVDIFFKADSGTENERVTMNIVSDHEEDDSVIQRIQSSPVLYQQLCQQIRCPNGENRTISKHRKNTCLREFIR